MFPFAKLSCSQHNGQRVFPVPPLGSATEDNKQSSAFVALICFYRFSVTLSDTFFQWSYLDTVSSFFFSVTVIFEVNLVFKYLPGVLSVPQYNIVTIPLYISDVLEHTV